MTTPHVFRIATAGRDGAPIRASPVHRLLTARGFFALDPYLVPHLEAALRSG